MEAGKSNIILDSRIQDYVKNFIDDFYFKISDGSVIGWCANTGRSIFQSCLSHDGEINTIDYASDVVITGSRDRTVKVLTFYLLRFLVS